jgi:hypothetical protein
MSFYNPSTGTATFGANNPNGTIAGADISAILPGMAIYLGSRDAPSGPLYIISSVTPTGTNGGSIVVRGTGPSSAQTSVPFTIDMRSAGSAAGFGNFVLGRIITALQSLTGQGSSVDANSRSLELDKQSSGAISRLLYRIAGVSQFEWSQRQVGGVEHLALRSTNDGSNWVDALLARRTDGRLTFGLTPQVNGADVAFAGSPLIRERLTAGRTYFIRSDGADTNTGLADNAGGAFLTYGRAMQAIAGLDLGANNVEIISRLASSSESVSLQPFMGSGTVTLTGDTGNPASRVISSNFPITAEPGARGWVVRGFRLANSAGFGGSIRSLAGARLTVGNVEFGATAANGRHASAVGGEMLFNGTISIAGGAAIAFAVENSGFINLAGRAITFNGASSTFSDVLFMATLNGVMGTFGLTSSGFSPTGSRFRVDAGGVIQNFGGLNALPGSTAGTQTAPGIYI